MNQKNAQSKKKRKGDKKKSLALDYRSRSS